MSAKDWGMPTNKDNEIIDMRVRQAAARLLGRRRASGRAITQKDINVWTGWVLQWTSDWDAFHAGPKQTVKDALWAAVETSQPIAKS